MRANKILMDNIKTQKHMNRARFMKMITLACQTVVDSEGEEFSSMVEEDLFDSDVLPGFSEMLNV